jgi:hypothetical protein
MQTAAVEALARISCRSVARDEDGMGRGSRNRVLGERLWDDRGLVWYCSLGTWATISDVGQALLAEQHVAVHGVDRPMMWLTPAQARRSWAHWREYFEVPGAGVAILPDAEGASTPRRSGSSRALSCWASRSSASPCGSITGPTLNCRRAHGHGPPSLRALAVFRG